MSEKFTPQPWTLVKREKSSSIIHDDGGQSELVVVLAPTGREARNNVPLLLAARELLDEGAKVSAAWMSYGPVDDGTAGGKALEAALERLMRLVRRLDEEGYLDAAERAYAVIEKPVAREDVLSDED